MENELRWLLIFVDHLGTLRVRSLSDVEDEGDAYIAAEELRRKARIKGKPWAAYRILFDDGHGTYGLQRWDGSNSPFPRG